MQCVKKRKNASRPSIVHDKTSVRNLERITIERVSLEYKTLKGAFKVKAPVLKKSIILTLDKSKHTSDTKN